MTELKKVMTFRSILFIIINSMMGTGIFFLPATGAGVAGPASIISWIIMSLVAIYISMCFAELTSMFPTSGGVYDFCKNTYGRFFSFIVGWTTMIIGNITIAMLIVGAIQYLLAENIKWIIILISIIFLVIFNTIAYTGMKTSATMLVTFSFITLGTIFSLIIPGILHFDASNLKPFFIAPISSVFICVFFIAETFFGWESATFLSEEVKDGEKIVPKALVLGTIIITFISLTFVLTSLGSVHWETFSKAAAPLNELGIAHYGLIGGSIFTLLVYLSIIGSVADWAVSSPRLILSLAKDKLFLSQFAEIHPKYFTPYKAIIFQTILSSILVIAGAGSYHTLLELLLPLLLFMYSIVMITVVVLRFKKPDKKRYFRAPLGKVGPLLIVGIFCMLLLTWIQHSNNALSQILLALSLIGLGFPLYFLIEMYHDPKMITSVNDFFAYITLMTEKIFLPISVRKEIISLLGKLKNKTILEFGCNVGSLTLTLAEHVGPDGKVYATDLSEKELKITRRRMEHRGHKHVEILHDPKLHSRVHSHIPQVECVVSVGMIGYLQHVENVLKGMNRRLDIGSRIVILDYDRFFYIIPNIPWLSDDKKIKDIFSKCGFNVGIIRKQGIAWQYIFIYGIKTKEI